MNFRMPGSKKYHYAIRCKWFSVPKTTHSGSRYAAFILITCINICKMPTILSAASRRFNLTNSISSINKSARLFIRDDSSISSVLFEVYFFVSSAPLRYILRARVCESRGIFLEEESITKGHTMYPTPKKKSRFTNEEHF